MFFREIMPLVRKEISSEIVIRKKKTLKKKNLGIKKIVFAFIFEGCRNQFQGRRGFHGTSEFLG